MNKLRTRNFWFLVLNICICISFSFFTVINHMEDPSKIYMENSTEKNAESDEKSAENEITFFISASICKLPLKLNHRSAENLVDYKGVLPIFWPSPNTPPPDLA
ncbi:hypothetical protein [Pedobacter insulae]|nr:hypothetical protein [Pedobacter insulae]